MPYKDKETQRAAQRKHQQKKRLQCLEIVQDAKRDVPCADCGIVYAPYVMDFDHIKGTKVAGIATLAGNGARAALLRELPKCELVCANCHRERTYGIKN